MGMFLPADRHGRFRNAGVVICAAAVVYAVFVLSGCGYKDTRLAVDKKGRTVVERYGQLQVIGTNLCNSEGQPVQLRGMSSHGLQWHGKYATPAVLGWLRDDWNSQVWRAAMYLTEGGYITNPALRQRVIDSIEAARETGVYVIVDWHVHRDRDPRAYQDRALEFFAGIAKEYGHLPNIIYEICNEPNGSDVTWSGAIKPYAEAVIAEIRKYDPDNIIIVGTPTWSRDVDIAAEDPITSFNNILYTLHFYAGSHGDELRAKVEKALSLGLPIFVTEWGTTQDTGGGGVFPEETLEWMSFLKKNNISWVNWSVNNKGEDSGVLQFNVDREAKGGWKLEELSPSGVFIRSVLRNEKKIP
ncbi:glycoside hydrolase family 5 protein [Teretinema zuelzerae]|nr:glycoside hydrolase family 5 protein [Teretinema zuelzerae]HPO03444.1 glycoside hydrolase family 5 protein [Treponemataceae bacterium]